MLRGHVGKKCLSTEHMSPLMESREPRLLFAGDSLSNSIQIDIDTGSGDDTMEVGQNGDFNSSADFDGGVTFNGGSGNDSLDALTNDNTGIDLDKILNVETIV